MACVAFYKGIIFQPVLTIGHLFLELQLILYMYLDICWIKFLVEVIDHWVCAFSMLDIAKLLSIEVV